MAEREVPVYNTTTGEWEVIQSTDQIKASNLAPGGSDGDVLTKSGGASSWATPSASSGGGIFPFLQSFGNCGW